MESLSGKDLHLNVCIQCNPVRSKAIDLLAWPGLSLSSENAQDDSWTMNAQSGVQRRAKRGALQRVSPEPAVAGLSLPGATARAFLQHIIFCRRAAVVFSLPLHFYIQCIQCACVCSHLVKGMHPLERNLACPLVWIVKIEINRHPPMTMPLIRSQDGCTFSLFSGTDISVGRCSRIWHTRFLWQNSNRSLQDRAPSEAQKVLNGRHGTGSGCREELGLVGHLYQGLLG